MPEVLQPSMAAGEVTPAMYARVDLQRYYIGLRTCRNFIVKPTGGVSNRPGTLFIESTKDSSKNSRLVEFRFSSSQAYLLEFGDYYMRVYYRGAPVLDVNDDPIELVTVYPYSLIREIDFTQSADVMTLCHQDYPIQQLGRYAHDDWRFFAFQNVNGPFGDINIVDGQTISASSQTGSTTITSNAEIFNAGMVGQMLQIEQNPEALVKQWEVEALISANDIRKTSTGYYRAVANGTTGTVRPDHLEGISYDGNPGVPWEYMHDGRGIVLITSFISAYSVSGTVLVTLPETLITGASAKTILGLTPGVPDVEDPETHVITPGTDASININGHGYALGGSVTIVGVTGTTGANGTWEISSRDANNFSLSGCRDNTAYEGGGYAIKTLDPQPSSKYALEAWGGDQGYPATSSYYQQRQIFGGTPGRPQAIQMSKSGGFLDFGTSVPTLDDDALNFSLNSGSVGIIQHFVGLKNLIALTTEGPWMIVKEVGNPLPVTDPQGEGGSASVRPIKINKQALYVEDKGGAIRSLGYEFSSDTYEGKDLTITADHLFEGHQIIEWAYQKIPHKVIWMVRDDGMLIGLTYLVEQEVVAWHRHDTDGHYESVCCVSEDTEDAVYFVVRRTINGVTKRYIEKLAPRTFSDPKEAFFVDCGLTYDGRTAGAGKSWTLSGGTEWSYTETLTFTTAVNTFTGISDVNDAIILTGEDGTLTRLKIVEYVSAKIVKVLSSKTVPEEFRGAGVGFGIARDTFAGLGHLEGKTVAILADNKVAPQKVVTAGTVTIPNAATYVSIGLPIEADIETLEVNHQGGPSQDRVKDINSVSLMVRETRGILAGPNEDNLLETRTEISTKYDDLYQTTTGNMPINIISDWSKGARVFIRQSDPLPVTILAIIPNVNVSGS